MFLWFFNRPWLTGAMLLLMSIMGVLGYNLMPRNLYPDAERPQVMIITQFPGASAEIMAQQVSRTMERELYSLSGIRLVQSTNRDGFAVIRTEFGYEKGLNGALSDVTNALERIRAKLPSGVLPYSLYPMGNFTPPALVLAVTPKPESGLDLMQTRYLIESDIRPVFLKQPKIANVEVFGGWQSSIRIEVNPNKLISLGLNLSQVVDSLKQWQAQLPLGSLLGDKQSWTLIIPGEKNQVDQLSLLPVTGQLNLGQVATIEWREQDRYSGYIGNGDPAIALSLQRPPGGTIAQAYEEAMSVLPEIQAKYPLLNISLTDTQMDIVVRANDNMFKALLEAVLFVSIVMMVFLANWRAVATALLSLPLVFLGTMAILWLFGKELNLFVTTGVILALGMLVDDAVVVLENIERHLDELHEDITVAVTKGVSEIVSPIWIGSLATVAVLAPLMFVGDYTEHVFSHVIFPVVTAVFVSYLVSITFIPRLVWFWYRNGIAPKNKIERALESHYQRRWAPISENYIGALRWLMVARWRRWLLIVGAFAMLVLSAKIVMPTIGQDALPASDMGIVQMRVRFGEQDKVSDVERKLIPVLEALNKDPLMVRYGVTIGAEAGVTSLGSGALASEATIMAHFTSRLERTKTSWDIADEWRAKLSQIEGVVSVDTYDFGNTMNSTIKAPITLRLSSDDWHNLPRAAEQVMAAVQSVRGVTSVSSNWSGFTQQVQLKLKPEQLMKFGLTPEKLAAQLPLQGISVASLTRWSASESLPVRIVLAASYTEQPQTLLMFPIVLPTGGSVPLNALAELEVAQQPMLLSTDELQYTLDLLVYRDHRALSHLLEDINLAVGAVNLPAGVTWRDAGDNAQGMEAKARMMKGLGVGILLLTIILIAAFASVRMALLTVAVLPLAAIGALWGLMFFGKAFALPALLGTILLFSIIVKNGILLMEFIHQRENQVSAVQAAEESIKLRFRPILMTALATIAGMLPIALERSIGLERLSPLSDVAIFGLLVGTVLSLLLLPTLYLWGKRV
jgi:multidrug efflux pump subunit AcrB